MEGKPTWGALLAALYELWWDALAIALGIARAQASARRPEEGFEARRTVKRYTARFSRLWSSSQSENPAQDFARAFQMGLLNGCIAAETASRRSLDTLWNGTLLSCVVSSATFQ